MQQAVLADQHGVTHWYIGRDHPRPGKNGKPWCNFGFSDLFVISATFWSPITWPTCLRCALKTAI